MPDAISMWRGDLFAMHLNIPAQNWAQEWRLRSDRPTTIVSTLWWMCHNLAADMDRSALKGLRERAARLGFNEVLNALSLKISERLFPDLTAAATEVITALGCAIAYYGRSPSLQIQGSDLELQEKRITWAWTHFIPFCDRVPYKEAAAGKASGAVVVARIHEGIEKGTEWCSYYAEDIINKKRLVVKFPGRHPEEFIHKNAKSIQQVAYTWQDMPRILKVRGMLSVTYGKGQAVIFAEKRYPEDLAIALDKRCETENHFSWEQNCRIFRSLLCAIRDVHGRGFWLQDLKLDNIVVHGLKVKLIDVGAGLRGDFQVGTDHYLPWGMSTELKHHMANILQNAVFIGQGMDIWAAGCIGLTLFQPTGDIWRKVGHHSLDQKHPSQEYLNNLIATIFRWQKFKSIARRIFGMEPTPIQKKSLGLIELFQEMLQIDRTKRITITQALDQFDRLECIA